MLDTCTVLVDLAIVVFFICNFDLHIYQCKFRFSTHLKYFITMKDKLWLVVSHIFF